MVVVKRERDRTKANYSQWRKLCFEVTFPLTLPLWLLSSLLRTKLLPSVFDLLDIILSHVFLCHFPLLIEYYLFFSPLL